MEFNRDSSHMLSRSCFVRSYFDVSFRTRAEIYRDSEGRVSFRVQQQNETEERYVIEEVTCRFSLIQESHFQKLHFLIDTNSSAKNLESVFAQQEPLVDEFMRLCPLKFRDRVT